MKSSQIQVITEGEFTEKHAKFIDEWMQRVRDRIAREQKEAQRKASTQQKPTA